MTNLFCETTRGRLDNKFKGGLTYGLANAEEWRETANSYLKRLYLPAKQFIFQRLGSEQLHLVKMQKYDKKIAKKKYYYKVTTRFTACLVYVG